MILSFELIGVAARIYFDIKKIYESNEFVGLGFGLMDAKDR